MPTSLDYLLVGHITADLTPNDRLLGGTVSFCAAVAKAFGLNVRVVTSAARGEPLLAQLEPYVSELIVLPSAETSTFENIYGPNGRTQYIRGVAAPISIDDIPAEWLTTPLVHLAPLTGEVDPEIAHHFKNSMVLLTLQGWLREWGADGRVRFKRWMDPAVVQDIDIVVFSEEDIVEASDLEMAFAQVTRHLFVTRAEKGGTYYHRGQAFQYDTPQVEVLNPTGAGDVFAASLLASLPVFENDFYRAVKVAAALAASSTTRFGLASAPTSEEVQRVLDEVRIKI